MELDQEFIDGIKRRIELGLALRDADRVWLRNHLLQMRRFVAWWEMKANAPQERRELVWDD